ncbi:MAG: DnaD domain protein [Lachnospiraceae bacterium]|nr:DnaD domain protein [Lachnospiraceae bacterium]
MEKILLQSERPSSTTCVPNVFIDYYMPSANGEYVKVYLYLLRCISHNMADCDLQKIADLFEYTKRDLTRAFVYWERMGLLELCYNDEKELCKVTLLDIPDGNTPTDPDRKRVPEQPLETVITKPIANANDKPSTKEYTRDDIQRFSDREDVGELIFIAERYLQKPLTQSEIRAFLYWYDSLGFSLDLIEYLVEYCVSGNHKSVRYMDKVALSWAESGISSVEAAKKHSNVYSQANYAVIKALGIKGRNLVELETSMIQKWTGEFHFSLDIITEACARTIAATHQPSFEYTDTILTNWYKAKVTELSDIEKLDAAFANKKRSSKENASHNNAKKAPQNRFNNFSQREYDYDALEQQMLNRSRN